MKSKTLLLAALTLFAFAGSAQAAQSGWIFDADRFHVSAHGQLECAECHEDVAGQKQHPDAARVNQAPGAGFAPSRCYECHAEIKSALAAGKHGERKVTDQAKYAKCLNCHDPHYLYRRGEGKQSGLKPGVHPTLQCGACHKEQKALPAPSAEDANCYACHVNPVRGGSPTAAQSAKLCFSCHDQAVGKKGLPVFSQKQFAKNPHAGSGCLSCHPQSARYAHNKQKLASCLECHTPHSEGVSGDAHYGVSCEACHLKGGAAVRLQAGGPVIFKRDPLGKGPTRVHELVDTQDDKSCERCHFSGNQVGAAAMVLPPKSVICMGCHSATLSVDDTVTMVALALFLLGLLATGAFWMSGGVGGAVAVFIKGLFSRRIGAILTAFVLDGLLQRRLWRFSRMRGFIHAMIFMPFLIRFTWGIIALVLTELWPACQVGQVMIQKNHPLTAFVFDFTAVMVVLGVFMAIMRRICQGRANRPAGMPKPDYLALGILFAIIVVGVVLEAMRIAMTGFPAGAGYAFIGYPLAHLLPGGGWLAGVYGYVWYLHAILTGAFVAYMPFSRMFHIFLAPILLAANAASSHEDHHND